MKKNRNLFYRRELIIILSILFLLPFVSAADNTHVQLYGTIVIISLVLLVFGYVQNDKIFMTLSGFLFIGLGIAFINVGFSDFSNPFLRNVLSITTIMFGGFIILNSGLKMMQEGI